MKSITRKFAAATAALIALIGTVPESRATDITLDGSGSYTLGTIVNYYPTGLRQSGRYTNLGGDDYHKATIQMRWISNNSTVRSGDLSFELWAMNFYGARKGIVLMTAGVKSIAAGRFYTNATRAGYSIFLNAYRYPELNLWEYTSQGWRWRDKLGFKRNDLL